MQHHDGQDKRVVMMSCVDQTRPSIFNHIPYPLTPRSEFPLNAHHHLTDLPSNLAATTALPKTDQELVAGPDERLARKAQTRRARRRECGCPSRSGPWRGFVHREEPSSARASARVG
jgi:hypothetical protein